MTELFLDSLFRTATEVRLPGGKTVTVRALGDAEIRGRESMARAEAARFRKKLKDENSDEHLSYISSLSELTDEQLRTLIVQMYVQLEAQDEARTQAKPQFVPVPEDANDEDKLDAEDAQKEEDERAQKEYEEILKSLSEAFRKNVESWDRDKLLAEAREWTTRSLAYTEFMRMTVLASLYMATEVKGKRFFQSLQEVDNANRTIVNLLYDAFIEVNDKDSWEIAKQALQGN